MPLHLRPADTPRLSETASPAPAATPPHPQWMYEAAWWNEKDCGDIWWPGREGLLSCDTQTMVHVYRSSPSGRRSAHRDVFSLDSYFSFSFNKATDSNC